MPMSENVIFNQQRPELIIMNDNDKKIHFQSQNKRMMNSLAFAVTQGKWPLCVHIWSREFEAGCIKKTLSIKHTRNVIYLYSSPEEAQLSTVCFFLDWL